MSIELVILLTMIGLWAVVGGYCEFTTSNPNWSARRRYRKYLKSEQFVYDKLADNIKTFDHFKYARYRRD